MPGRRDRLVPVGHRPATADNIEHVRPIVMPVRLDFLLDCDRPHSKGGGLDYHLVGEPLPLLPLLDLIAKLEGMVIGVHRTLRPDSSP